MNAAIAAAPHLRLGLAQNAALLSHSFFGRNDRPTERSNTTRDLLHVRNSMAHTTCKEQRAKLRKSFTVCA